VSAIRNPNSAIYNLINHALKDVSNGRAG
jgi:hypothetical protein